jgi:hypothetical protein
MNGHEIGTGGLLLRNLPSIAPIKLHVCLTECSPAIYISLDVLRGTWLAKIFARDAYVKRAATSWPHALATDFFFSEPGLNICVTVEQVAKYTGDCFDV